jgi:hypothetical protein
MPDNRKGECLGKSAVHGSLKIVLMASQFDPERGQIHKFIRMSDSIWPQMRVDSVGPIPVGMD